MKRILVVVFVFSISQYIHAQDKSFDLSNYKFPDYKRKELEFNFSSSGQYQTSDGSSSFDFNAYPNIGLTYENLTRKKIDYIYFSLYGQFDINKDHRIYYSNNEPIDGYYDDENNTSITSGLDFYWDRQVYFNKSKFFIEISNYLQYGLQYDFRSEKRSYNNEIKTEESKNSNQSVDIKIGFGGGIGRIEKVNDFWQAYYMLAKLKGQKSLAREFAEDDIYEFATLVSQLKNKRFFDSRLRKIAELQELDSFLQKKGLVDDTNITYFTTLNDYWSYGSFGERKSGTVLKVLLGPEYETYFIKNSDEDNTILDQFYLTLSPSLESYKQKNLYWEQHFKLSVASRAYYYETIEEDYYGIYYITEFGNLLKANAEFGYGFFPDSRTSLNFAIGYLGETKGGPSIRTSGTGELESFLDDKYWANNPYLNIGGYYYISPQLQIALDFNLNYTDKYGYYSDNTYSRIYTTYNLSLRYAIF
jgi:hypothetical protein